MTDRHRTQGFTCGEPALDRWLVEHALLNQRRSLSRTFVGVDDAPGHEAVPIAGYITLVAAAVEVEQLPSSERRGLVGLDQIGAALVARLARDERHAHRQLGAWLLQQGLHRIIAADEHLAIRAVLVDALNDRAAEWYAGWGFTPLPGGPADRLWLPMKRVRASLGR
ncbi:MAG: GNAT family N-acetyltransferase [Egibacteraceae bacterium]